MLSSYRRARLTDVSASAPIPELKHGKRLMVLYVGFMESQDGVRLFIEAIAHLVRQNRHINTHFPFNDRSTMIKILEYMAYSNPTVMFDLTEGRRTASDSALYARPNDPSDFAEKIATLLESDSLRENLGQIGRSRTNQSLIRKPIQPFGFTRQIPIFPLAPS